MDIIKKFCEQHLDLLVSIIVVPFCTAFKWGRDFMFPHKKDEFIKEQKEIIKKLKPHLNNYKNKLTNKLQYVNQTRTDVRNLTLRCGLPVDHPDSFLYIFRCIKEIFESEFNKPLLSKPYNINLQYNELCSIHNELIKHDTVLTNSPLIIELKSKLEKALSIISNIENLIKKNNNLK